ncbi:structural protein P5 [Vibrio ostreicida]|uniref:structural protein P5 n=1 Tax=Vibrio ostreicida TaxID=526588 RepID=UPI003B59103E
MTSIQQLSLAAIAVFSGYLVYRQNSSHDGEFLANVPAPLRGDGVNLHKLMDAIMIDSATIRGLRNNNPGNIEHDGTAWRGLVGNDGRFIIFDRAENGIRAIARILNSYERLHGITTLEGIISRWAPPVENNTESYIQHAEQVLNMSRHSSVGEQQKADLIKVIIRHENGQQPYSDKVIYDGIAAA